MGYSVYDLGKKMKYQTINGWTKEAMKARLREKVPAHGAIVEQQLSAKCVYRTKEGKACFAGAFIPDEIYRPIMEGTAVQSLIEGPYGLGKVMPLETGGIVALQHIHDQNALRLSENKIDVVEKGCEWIEKNVEDGQ